MAVNISLAQFNRIASGEYNAGFIDFKTDADGKVLDELKKVNNHVHAVSKNTATISHERVLEIKEAFIAALERANVPPEKINEIRRELGIETSMDATSDKEQLGQMLQGRFKPLTRQQVREILDKYAQRGKGYTEESAAAVSAEDDAAALRTANMSKERKDLARNTDRMNVETANLKRVNAEVFKFSDVLNILSANRSLASLSEARLNRITAAGANAQDLRKASVRDLGSGIATLFSVALKLQAADATESPVFSFLGSRAKFVKGEGGMLSAVVDMGASKTTVKLGFTAETLVRKLIGLAITDRDTIGGAAIKEMLNAAHALDIKNGLAVNDRTSLTRAFSAKVLEMQGYTAGLPDGGVPVVDLGNGEYSTGLLVQIAQRSLDGKLDGENVLNTKQKLDDYYGKVRKDTAKLPDDIKQMLQGVLDMPIELDEDGSFIVRSQLAGANIGNQVNAIHPVPPPPLPQDITLADIKDFVADLVFSNDTMVTDAVADHVGELMRRTLSEPKKLAAFTAIIKDLNVLDSVTSEAVATKIKAGFVSLKEKLDTAFKAANNDVSIDAAKAQQGFDARFAAFFRDPDKLSSAVLAEFEEVLDNMAMEACSDIQAFINQVFNISNTGADIVSDPYKTMKPEDIKAELDKKSLNDILDAAATNEVPGQVGFFKQVVSTYFTSLDQSDKRSCLAAALRYSNVFDFAGIQGQEELDSAKRAALNKFTGAILKGAGPLLHKMMQGLPKSIMGPYADALDDMKQNLAPIPRKIVQAYLNQLIADSQGKIKKIKMEKSLGAASVGEAFLCKFYVMKRSPVMRQATREELQTNPKQTWIEEKDEQGNVKYHDVEDERDVVVKIMRHDAERRMEAEAQIFSAAATKIPGMSKTWEGQLAQYRTEFDFTIEARNIEEGVRLYNVAGVKNHPMRAMAPAVASMKLSDIAPTKKHILVAKRMPGVTIDEFIKDETSRLRSVVNGVFEQDPATGRIKWVDKLNTKTNETEKKPVLKKDIPATAISNGIYELIDRQKHLASMSAKLIQATKLWFYNALIGDGKFHGDAHSGNIMCATGQVGFIDFGNLYELKKDRKIIGDNGKEITVNEQHELLRVIRGAAFREKKFIFSGFEKLMTPEGRELLKKEDVKAKANAILDSVLASRHGQFSFNIVYRLQAAIVELQKLGLELPPQINCFIQSLVRLSNTITEVNTIINQSKAMLKAAMNVKRPAPADRDPHDFLGKIFDAYASEAGKKNVPYQYSPDQSALLPLPQQPPNVMILDEGDEEDEDFGPPTCPAYRLMLCSPEFGGIVSKGDSPVFTADTGTYVKSLLNRLRPLENPVEEAEKIVNKFIWHLDVEHSNDHLSLADFARNALETLRSEMQEAGNMRDAKLFALWRFSNAFAHVQADALEVMRLEFEKLDNPQNVPPPSTFASAITDVLFDSFMTLVTALGGDSGTLVTDARNIVNSELGGNISSKTLDIFALPTIVDKLQEDARKIGGDNSYQINIGV